MTTKDFTANVISATKVVPDGNFKDSKASGIWDINEALDLIKGGNWPNAANFNPSAFVDALFQTHVHAGDGTNSRAIVNNINFTGSGGLFWIKCRTVAESHNLFDTERGATKVILSDATDATDTVGTTVFESFNNNGVTIGSHGRTNESSRDYVSWSFRKQPKFFDIVTYEGTGSARTVAHSLNTTVGMIIVKNLDQADNWAVYHRGDNGGSSPDNFYMSLNLTDASNNSATRWNDTAPTSSVFTVGTDHSVNASGENYVAYLFAHNNDDGGFGEPGDQDIIKCGTYTGNGSTQSIALGFEPQFVLLKNTGSSTGSSSNWVILDNMRGVVTSSSAADDKYLFPNSSTTEGGGIPMNFTATGFDLDNEDTSNKNTDAFIYMAIRRGGMQTPTAASDVFHVQSQSDGDTYSVGFPTDLILLNKTGGSSANTYVGNRLLGNSSYFVTSSTAVEASSSNLWTFDLQNSFDQGASTSAAWVGYHWARARGYFDVVTYTGNATNNHEIKHNLGVAPEMVWTKQRTSDARNFVVYHSALGNTNTLALNTNGIAEDESSGMHADPTASSIFLKAANSTNANNQDYIAHLFATVAGVSKVGSYTGNGSTTGPTIDCGFSGSPSFILIKKATGGTGSWAVFDSARGIVAGNESQIYLNSTGAAQTATDQIDPTSSGFQIVINSATLNSDGETYIFYAIAATS